jgi:hypothetical protein
MKISKPKNLSFSLRYKIFKIPSTMSEKKKTWHDKAAEETKMPASEHPLDGLAPRNSSPVESENRI